MAFALTISLLVFGIEAKRAESSTADGIVVGVTTVTRPVWTGGYDTNSHVVVDVEQLKYLTRVVRDVWNEKSEATK